MLNSLRRTSLESQKGILPAAVGGFDSPVSWHDIGQELAARSQTNIVVQLESESGAAAGS